MAIDCGCEARSARLRSLAASLRNAAGTRWAPEQRRDLARKLVRLSRAGDGDWDEDPNHLAQAVDAVLDEALEAFASNMPDQGVALVVAACATVDGLLEAMGLSDADEPEGDGDDSPMPNAGSYSAAQGGEERAWNGPAAMSRCAKSKAPASCFSLICAGRRAGPADQEGTWALPHHDHAGGPPNQAGVSAALGRLDQTQGLINKAAARAHLLAHQKAAQSKSASARFRPPRDGLYRGVLPIEMRNVNGGGWAPVMAGHWAVFNRWTRIDSLFEGEFMESISPGAFKKTFQDGRDTIQPLFQHGRDFTVGSKVLGPVEVLEEDGEGAYSEVPLFDTSYNRDILPGLMAGSYGASFRFRVMKEDVTQEPGRSSWNPDGIPERVIREAQVMEFGPVTFPAYQDAKMTVGDGRMQSYRSLTDFFLADRLASDPERFREVLHQAGHRDLLGEHEHLQEESARSVAPAPVLPSLEEWLEQQRAGGLRVARPH